MRRADRASEIIVTGACGFVRRVLVERLVAEGADLNEIARQGGRDPGVVSYRPDATLEDAFGTQPALSAAADRLQLVRDGTLEQLVAAGLATPEPIEGHTL